ncbi:hypothetical protein FACS1894211_15130 [Clostridia bacterium]|nr:hypothetical protein FACS1894211_15130 [Clostridia bacterium]
MAILSIQNLSFTYNGANRKALSGVNLEVEKGQFVVVCGESGCGKSTLLRLVKKQLAPKGKREGSILYNAQLEGAGNREQGTGIGCHSEQSEEGPSFHCALTDVEDMDERVAVTDIGFVMQNPDNQIVTDKVWHELAFGLEALGEKPDVIRKRIAEICGFFGITDWYHKNTSELSGGQKQLLNLAAVMLMQPNILILDEPSGQLDPVAATEFIATLLKINRELGLTILLVEHRLEDVFPLADKVVLMNKAEILLCGSPREVGLKLKETDPQHKMRLGLPAAVRLFNLLGAAGECPLTVKEGRDFLERTYMPEHTEISEERPDGKNRAAALEIQDGFFRYARNAPDILKGLSLKVYENETLCVLGGNGAGKTTMLKILSGVKRVHQGAVRVWGKKIKDYTGGSLYRENVALLPQNPQSVFVKDKLIDDLREATALMSLKREAGDAEIRALCDGLGIGSLLESHPYDLSGGEQQKAALVKMLLLRPRILLLDEPTKGIDAYSKTVLSDILKRLKAEGKTIVIVTHDVEFAAQNADRCAMFFDGRIVSEDAPAAFFAGNTFYTTAAYRISRGFYKNAVTVEAVAELCGRNPKKL